VYLSESRSAPVARRCAEFAAWDESFTQRKIRSILQEPRRLLLRNIETNLARALITGEVEEGSDLTFTIRDDELAFDHQPAVAMSNRSHLSRADISFPEVNHGRCSRSRQPAMAGEI
jgi:hypothetical protein